MSHFRPGDRVLVNHGRGEIEADMVWASSRHAVITLPAFANEKVLVDLDQVRHDPHSHGEGPGRTLPPRPPTYTETLETKNERLEAAVKAVDKLIQESEGVEGLHLNGDVAPWDELLAGGPYELWLRDLSAVLEEAEHE